MRHEAKRRIGKDKKRCREGRKGEVYRRTEAERDDTIYLTLLWEVAEALISLVGWPSTLIFTLDKINS